MAVTLWPSKLLEMLYIWCIQHSSLAWDFGQLP